MPIKRFVLRLLYLQSMCGSFSKVTDKRKRGYKSCDSYPRWVFLKTAIDYSSMITIFSILSPCLIESSTSRPS